MKRINAVYLTEALEDMLNILQIYEGKKRITVENEICLPMRQSMSMIKKYSAFIKPCHHNKFQADTREILNALGIKIDICKKKFTRKK